MTLDRRHTLALIGATLTSAIALGDAVTHGLTGQSSVFAGDSFGSVAIVSYPSRFSRQNRRAASRSAACNQSRYVP